MKLSLAQAGQLAEVLLATTGNRKVARAMDDGNVIYGEARSIGTNGGAMDWDSDVRDQYLRVTARNGCEYFWKISDLMPLVATGEFVVGYEPPPGY